MATDLTDKGPDERLRGASALVLGGQLTEGVSDLSEEMTAPGGVPALREVNQDRSHPEAPLVEEQPHRDFRRLVRADADGHVARGWDNVSSGARGPVKTDFPPRPRADQGGATARPPAPEPPV